VKSRNLNNVSALEPNRAVEPKKKYILVLQGTTNIKKQKFITNDILS
jgi:hypothetical protein